MKTWLALTVMLGCCIFANRGHCGPVEVAIVFLNHPPGGTQVGSLGSTTITDVHAMAANLNEHSDGIAHYTVLPADTVEDANFSAAAGFYSSYYLFAEGGWRQDTSGRWVPGGMVQQADGTWVSVNEISTTFTDVFYCGKNGQNITLAYAASIIAKNNMGGYKTNPSTTVVFEDPNTSVRTTMEVWQSSSDTSKYLQTYAMALQIGVSSVVAHEFACGLLSPKERDRLIYSKLYQF